MPIVDVAEAKDLDQKIEELLQAAPADREKRLREIFVEKLDFSPASGPIDLRGARCPVKQATRIATAEGVHVVWAILDAERIRISDTRAISKALADLVGDHLLVASNADTSVWQFIYPATAAAKPILRRIVVERGLPRRTVVTQLAKVYYDARTVDIRAALENAYNVEPVTKEFFRTYADVFERVMGMVKGVRNEDDRRLFCQTLFNRLMFIYFLQRKGWLLFDGGAEYLKALRRASRNSGDENFYSARLKVLFFAGLNNPQSVDLTLGASPAIGKVPFLNGGLFEETDMDQRYASAVVPDKAFDLIFGELFERFNFTVSENTPYDIEVAVDPEMLGKVFEELVTGRHESGSYYTPRPVVAFMCREAIKGYLEAKVDGLSADAIRRFTDEHNVEELDVTQAGVVAEALDAITVCDPACGSGAYLVGMLHELVELKQALYSDKLGRDPTKLYEMKLHIIERNLYGTDIDAFAINIAMLRLWLSLVIDFAGLTPPPLPNLDFKIACGDSLTAPNPEIASDLFRHAVHDASIKLAQLKAQYLRESGPKKAGLKSQIIEAERRLQKALAESPPPDDAIDWRVDFAEVFADGGFHVVLANPPYVRADAKFKHLKPNEELRQLAVEDWKAYRESILASKIYGTLYEKWDLFVPFLERAHQLLMQDGQMVFIISDAYNTAKYAERSHSYFAKNVTIARIDFCSDIPLFEAGVANSIVHFAKQVPPAGHIPVRATRWGESPEDFDAHVQLLSPVPQAESGVRLFRPEDAGTPLATGGTLTLGMLCYISYGLRANADDRYWPGAFTTDDCLSTKRDAVHPKPFVQGKDLVKWQPRRISYLEWGTKRAPDQFSRPTFPELHQAKEKLIAVRTPGRTPKVIYDDRGLYFDASSVGFVPWHHLKDVRNRSILKTAQYKDEVQAHRGPPSKFRKDLEELSSGFDAKYLLAILNSSLVQEWLASRRRSKIHIYPDDWKSLPIPAATLDQQSALVDRVNEIEGLFRKFGETLPASASEKRSALEGEIDQIVTLAYSN